MLTHAAPRRWRWVGVAAMASWAGMAPAPFAAQAVESQPAQTTTVEKPNVVKLTTGMSFAALAGRPDTDTVELPNGRQMSVRDVRRFDAAAAKLRAPRIDRVPAELKFKPAASGQSIKSAGDLRAALGRSPSETVQMPSGRVVTVGQLQFAQKLAEKRLGQPLNAGARSARPNGPVSRVSRQTTKEQWTSLLNGPEDAVLESPDGKQHITIGQLKQALAEYAKARPARQKGRPR